MKREWSWIVLVCAFVAVYGYGEELYLKDGSVLRGTVVSRSDSSIVFRADGLGEFRISPESVSDRQVDPDSAAEPLSTSREVRLRKGEDADPLSHALFFMPTAFNPLRNTFTFRDFELFFLTFGYSPTSATTITAGFMFPVTTEFQLLTFGFKQQLWHTTNEVGDQTALAVTGNFTKPVIPAIDEEFSLVSGNLVLSRRFKKEGFSDGLGIHGALGYTGVSYTEYDYFGYGSSRTRWIDNFSFAGGVEMRMGPHSKLMAEYLSSAPFDPTGSSYGLFTVGVRVHGTRLSADLAGFRPVGPDTGDLFLWPLINIGYRF